MSIEFEIQNAKFLDEVYVIKPSINIDKRGNIWTSFLKDEIDILLPKNLTFIQDKFSQSKKNVLRGIHGDKKSWKLVTCVYGDIQQVVVDLRAESNTFKKYESFEINAKNQMSILIPPRFGNAYYVKSKLAIYHYKLAYDGDYIDASDQFTYRWDDSSIKINWLCNNPILSERDKIND